MVAWTPSNAQGSLRAQSHGHLIREGKGISFIVPHSITRAKGGECVCGEGAIKPGLRAGPLVPLIKVAAGEAGSPESEEPVGESLDVVCQ